MNKPHIHLKGDSVIWVIIFALCAVSLVEVFSAMSMLSYSSGNVWIPFIRQAALLAGGIAVCILLHNIPCSWYRYISAAWPFIFILLCITAFTGGEVNGAARWFNIGGMTFQPSELAKGVLVATVALVLSRCREGNGVNKSALKYVVFFSLPIILLIFKENISTAVFLCGVIFVMMFVAGVPTRQMLGIIAVGAAFGIIGFICLKTLPRSVDDPFYKTSVGAIFKRVPTAQERIFGNSLVITADPDSLVLTDKPDDMFLKVLDIVAAGRYPYMGLLARLKDKDHEIVMQSLDTVGITELAERNFISLSDGEKQKVMIAKALAQDTPIIFMDEPAAFLDYPSKIELIHLMKRLSREQGKTILFSSHDLELLLRYSDQMWLVAPKKSLKVGSPKELVDNGIIDKYFPPISAKELFSPIL